MFGLAEEIHRKAVDQIAWLLSAYECGRITAETFRIGVETIWNVCGGVINTREFNDLMHDANAEVANLPIETKMTAMVKGQNMLLFVRDRERTHTIVATPETGRFREFPVEDEAIEIIAKLKTQAAESGFHPVKATIDE